LYSEYFPLTTGESEMIGSVFKKAVKKTPSIKKSLDALKNIFIARKDFDDERNEKALNFFLRCMQLTGPLMAKGVEDTVMYHYNCFIGHNEVGDHPGSQGISAEKFHKLMVLRQKNWPMSMNGTSTHDTKRGEDVRARLNVITEMPAEWIKNVRSWMKLNRILKISLKGKQAPDANEEYFIYQTLAGVFPVNGKADDVFLKRMDEYLLKSLREGKTNSNWLAPEEEYEMAVSDFTRKILDPQSRFLKSFKPSQKKISEYGIVNSLSQLLLKATSPGIPDFYQGSELWDLSLVDPDNRRSVDYSQRLRALKQMIRKSKKDPEDLFNELYRQKNDARIKLWMTHILLEERKSYPDLFLLGKYVPLKITGKYSDHIIAFARVHDNSWLVTVVPLFLSLISDKAGPDKVKWSDTAIELPDIAPRKWSSPFFKNEFAFEETIPLSGLMKFSCPVFIRGNREVPRRYAGVLAHISSLPGKYGTGDLGDEAYEFADLLSDNGQTFWQILPLNPTGGDYEYSPYSSASAFAANTLFLSPDLLVRSGLLTEESFRRTKFRETDRTDFKKASDFRNMISDEVFTNFFCREKPYRQMNFKNFCKNESYWLNDFVLFNILKREFDNVPWNEWPEKLKNRNSKSMDNYFEKFESEIKKEKLYQYLFQEQWTSLKRYCNIRGIRIIGDMSFYVNYDSAEVWAHPEFFKLDTEKRPKLVAGVPPDYFSSTGQLWNMPVYNWTALKKSGYEWWLKRIRRNLDLCDLVRFDHFRGFSAYWEVPFGETTAVNGKWTSGPGDDFFGKVKEEFPEMPFIAEDLGWIDDKVYKLRDDFSLPGMVVLQFAFGDNTPQSGYMTHNHNQNCVVYTGTHDNNTTRGWYLNELSDKNRKEAAEYAGHPVKDETCNEDFIRMAYSSVAKIAIIPVQDLLGLDAGARLNTPSTSGKNWDWKMKKSDLGKVFTEKVRRMVVIYGRI
jgi:4-alpha-glucanotransferase